MRKLSFDVLKAIAIIAVVLYHLGICKNGYLGVDVFLVIAGYFTINSIEKQQNTSGGGYLQFVLKRLFRLWPLLLVAGLACLVVGYILMLPDDYENLAQSVIATNIFANNILQAITTKNYWDVLNEYKPLMHTWYVGVLMQFYVCVPLILFLLKRLVKNCKSSNYFSIGIIALLGVISLSLYLLSDNAAVKFYYLPYRLFEFCAGALVYYVIAGKTIKPLKHGIWLDTVFCMIYGLMVFLLLGGSQMLPAEIKLLLVVCATSFILWLIPNVAVSENKLFSNKYLAVIGSASYSLFVWHQIVFAFTRYSFTSEITRPIALLTITIIIVALSGVSYNYIENIKANKLTMGLTLFLCVLTIAPSFLIYNNAGVVRNIPELGVSTENVHRGMWAEYCDEGYKYDKDFVSDANMPKWLVIGNSFGRDMVNIISESTLADSVEVSYSTMTAYKDKLDRFADADVVILSTLGVDVKIIEEVESFCQEKSRFIIVGEKNFGVNNGQVYRRRFSDDYLKTTVKMENGYATKNEMLKLLYPENYIDMISLVQSPDGRMPVFSDEGMFISQDCRHLTKAGAKYYAKLIDWDKFGE